MPGMVSAQETLVNDDNVGLLLPFPDNCGGGHS